MAAQSNGLMIPQPQNLRLITDWRISDLVEGTCSQSCCGDIPSSRSPGSQRQIADVQGCSEYVQSDVQTVGVPLCLAAAAAASAMADVAKELAEVQVELVVVKKALRIGDERLGMRGEPPQQYLLQ